MGGHVEKAVMWPRLLTPTAPSSPSTARRSNLSLFSCTQAEGLPSTSSYAPSASLPPWRECDSFRDGWSGASNPPLPRCSWRCSDGSRHGKSMMQKEEIIMEGVGRARTHTHTHSSSVCV